MTAVDLLSRVRIKAMLIGDRRVGDLDINVDVHKGTAVLQGEVESEEQKQIAEELTWGVQGISEVENELTVNLQKGAAGEGKMKTVELTDEVERKIAEDGRITSKNINVTVDDGTAHLTGIVDSLEEYYLVQEAVESVPEIESVENDLRIEEGHSGHRCNCGRM